MRTSLRVFTAPAIAGLVLLASAPGAQAAPAPVSEFDAPIFGTTATLTEGRMPTYAEVNCSDARCTSGVIIGAEGGSTAYISTTVARGGAFAESPGFVAKLNKNWAGLSGNYSEDFSTFTINLTQVLPETDIAALVAADAAKYGGTLSTPTTQGDTTVWSATGDFNDARWVVSYVSRGDALARGTCLQYGTERDSVTCPPANVQSITTDVVTSAPPTTLAGVRSIAGLVPSTPASLDPQLLNIEPTRPLWFPNDPTPALERALGARANSVSLQYGVAGYPELLFTAKVAAVSSEAPARPWTATVCDSATPSNRTCAKSRIGGKATGWIGAWSMRNPADGTGSISSHFTGKRRLGDVQCSIPGTVGAARALTSDEIRACTKAITTFANAVVR